MQEVTHGGVDDGGVLLALDLQALVSIQGTGHQGSDVETGHANGQKAHGSEDAETAAHVVWNHEAHVVLLGGQGLEGAFLGIRDGDDTVCCFGLSIMCLQVLLYNTEGHGGFRGGTALRYHDAGHITLCGKVHELGQIFLGEVVAGKDHLRGILALELLCKVVAEGFQNALGAKVGAANADGDDQVHSLLDPLVADGFILFQLTVCNLLGKFLPAQEIVAGAGFVLEYVKGVQRLFYVRFILGLINERLASMNVNFNHNIVLLL